MARGKKKDAGDGEDAAPPKATTAAKPSEVKKMISGAKLKNLMAAKRSAKKDTAEISGQVGQMIRDAQENNHLHRKAFGTICQLDAMEPEKIRDYLDHFNYYLDVSGINKRAEAAPRLPMGDEPGAGADDDEDEAANSNVARFPGTAAAE